MFSIFVFVFVFVFAGWQEVVVVVIFVSEWRKVVERGHGNADDDDGCSGACFLVDDGVGTSGDCCWEAAFDSSEEANFSFS